MYNVYTRRPIHRFSDFLAVDPDSDSAEPKHILKRSSRDTVSALEKVHADTQSCVLRPMYMYMYHSQISRLGMQTIWLFHIFSLGPFFECIFTTSIFNLNCNFLNMKILSQFLNPRFKGDKGGRVGEWEGGREGGREGERGRGEQAEVTLGHVHCTLSSCRCKASVHCVHVKYM